METLALRGLLAWPWVRGAHLAHPALRGNPESLAFLDSQAGLVVQGKQEGQERGEKGERKENAGIRAEMAFPASLDHLALLAPRWPLKSQALDWLESKDLLDSRVPRGSQAVMVTLDLKETGVYQASKAMWESLERGVMMATQ